MSSMGSTEVCQRPCSPPSHPPNLFPPLPNGLPASQPPPEPPSLHGSPASQPPCLPAWRPWRPQAHRGCGLLLQPHHPLLFHHRSLSAGSLHVQPRGSVLFSCPLPSSISVGLGLGTGNALPSPKPDQQCPLPSMRTGRLRRGSVPPVSLSPGA